MAPAFARMLVLDELSYSGPEAAMRVHALLVSALIGMAAATSAHAEDPIGRPVDLALVLLTDVSKSMDDQEYEMVKQGYRAAFADPEVIAALLANAQGVAITYVEFSGKNDFTIIRGWDVLTDAASMQVFSAAIAAAPRSSHGGTALAPSLRKSIELLKQVEPSAARRVIDVASDHPNDDGRSGLVRDLAVAAGITINALPIVDGHPVVAYDGHLTYATQQWGFEDIIAFYRNHVIGGPGSFLIEARDYAAFGAALKRKLLRELISSPETASTPEVFALAH
jgi:hypothetical protein